MYLPIVPRRSQQLSSAVVTAATAFVFSWSTGRGRYPIVRKMSTITTTSSLLNHAVRYMVGSSSTGGEYKARHRGQKYIESIFQPYEVIPNSHEMKVLHNVIDLEGTSQYHIVVRAMMEDFWQQVIATTETDRVCALGVPGIGKTSMTCILIRLLLQQNKTVAYHIRTVEKLGYVYIFSPHTINTSSTGSSSRDGTTRVDVRTIKEQEFRTKSISDPSTYYVVDPGQTKDTCDPSNLYFQGKVIILASPYEEHWGRFEFTKRRWESQGNQLGTFCYIPAWSLSELMASSTIMMENGGIVLTEEEIRNRFHRMGGVPQYIFTKFYKEAIQEQQKVLELLTLDVVKRLACKNWYSIHYYSEYAADSQKNILLNYVLAEKDSGKYTDDDILVQFISDYVRDYIVTKYMPAIWYKLLQKEDPIHGPFDPSLYVSYCKQLLYNPVQPYKMVATVRAYASLADKTIAEMKEEEMLQETTLQEEKVVQTNQILLGGLHQSAKVENAVQSAVSHPSVLFHPIQKSENDQWYDFVYQENGVYYIFQCSLEGKPKGTCSNQMHELVTEILYRAIPTELLETTLETKLSINELQALWCTTNHSITWFHHLIL
jgi:hypothetical protein